MPEEIAATRESYKGQYLKRVLKRRPNVVTVGTPEDIAASEAGA
jgi:hypothetical protein